MTEEQMEEARSKMLNTFAGLDNGEAFSQIFNDVADILFGIVNERGETTDEDLLEKTQWRLENTLGYKPENDFDVSV